MTHPPRSPDTPAAILQLLRQGRHKAAFKSARTAMRRHKSNPVFANLAGIALGSAGQQREALGYFRKALALDPAFHDARKNLAQTLVLCGQAEAALKPLTRLCADQPGDAGGWYLLAQARLATGDAAGAEDAAGHAIDADPKQGRAHNLRGLARQRLGRLAEAVSDHAAALRLNPRDIEAMINQCAPLSRLLRDDEALALARRAVEGDPAHAGARLALGAQLMAAGRMDDAAVQYRAILDHAPRHARALERLAALGRDRDENTLAAQVAAALKSAPKGSEDRALLGFAAARIATRQQDDTAAARHLSDANAIMATRLPHDRDRDRAHIRSSLARFEPGMQVAPHPAAGDAAGLLPIYILGLPRSGTTLAEAMLAAHGDVRAMGERATPGMLLAPLIETGADFDTEAAAAFARADRAALPGTGGAGHYTDKMPENYRLVGFLRTACPAARFICLRRDPRDVALSMWREIFDGTALAYTYDLAAMADRFNLFAEAMRHWHRVFPGDILDLRYEVLVTDPQAASQAMARHCGLEWTPQMAHPEQGDGAVLTASATQLRQPVHARSVGKWRQHADMLAPFIAGLDPELWPEIR
ncbi:tetratricopeptide repeat-containing sulfotransferase family protein [Pukyongiella litopenaei]|uniref:Sulfotransferase family protein n=1 Tax=Pukyongiella litopenaei TaxID=2605946 RepID=A0A2S0MTY0_9RHOB|nr:tetratricopeptide repeat-containing sulfotransferase family protein [Pukyongiella litopenaei]AVO39349.1 sulfotransferase family protein [Pukyongiella litopenaei]